METNDLVQLGLLVVGVITIYSAIRRDLKLRRFQFFIEYTRRYQELILHMPKDIETMSVDDSEVKKHMRLYFDLCSEEYYMNMHGLIDKKVWALWVDGIETAMSRPIYKNAWEKLGHHYDDDNFKKFMNDFMKKIKTLLIAFTIAIGSFCHVNAQSYNQERTALSNFLVRMYKAEPFEGVKVVSDYDNNYLLSVVLVKNGASETALNRIAQVKSQRQVSQYLGGLVQVSSETIIRTTEKVKEEKTIEEVTDIIRENSIGFTKAMEVLTVIDAGNNQKCYMFYRKVEEMKE